MDWYSIIKFLHVSSAVIWIGGAFIMVILGVMIGSMVIAMYLPIFKLAATI